MSMNLHCFILHGSVRIEVHGLVQTPTSITYHVIGENRPWKESAKLYLEWVASIFPGESGRDARKRQRKIIGDAWAMADETGARLLFEAW